MASKFTFHIEDMEARYRAGETLQMIGDSYGVTREYIRQLLARRGLSAKQGGASVRAAARRNKKLADREKIYGCTMDEWRQIPKRAKARFSQQKTNAARRGIEWRLTLGEWWRIWQQSGKWEQRGRAQGYCMGRIGDCGPYSAENAYICTIGQNFSDSYIWKPAHKRKRKPLSEKYATARRISAVTGIAESTIVARLDRGWSPEQAISTPLILNNTRRAALARA